MTVTHLDKNGNIITDLSKVIIPEEIELEILQILNPELTFERGELA